MGGWIDLRSESPEPETPLLPVEMPELDNGPHFFYGLQWWFFGALAIFGFLYLVYDESRGGRGPWGRARETTGQTTGRTTSERAEQPAVDGKHDARQE
jgi:hypothetical protein